MISRVESGSCGAGDRGDIVLGWLVRLVALLALVGVLAFDALSVASARLSIEDQASDAARAAADTWATRHDAQSSFDSAWRNATEANATNELNPKTFSVSPNGTAHVTLSRTAPTFVVRLIPPLRHLAVIRADGVSKGSTA